MPGYKSRFVKGAERLREAKKAKRPLPKKTKRAIRRSETSSTRTRKVRAR